MQLFLNVDVRCDGNAEQSVGTLMWCVCHTKCSYIVPRKESSRCQAVYYHESVTLDVEGHRIMIPIAMG